MKKIILLITFITGLQLMHGQAQAQKDTTPPGSVVLAYYEGRTACKELMAALQEGYREACAKRKLSLILYVDSATRRPSSYKIRGVGIRSGKGKWTIEKGTPTDPEAVVYRLDMGAVSMLLLKGDEQVLFILDQDKRFLVGNAKYGYTLNRVMDKLSWHNWRNLVHRGMPF